MITAANIPNLAFTPVNGGTGSPYTTFTFAVTDASGATSAVANETVNVTPTTADDGAEHRHHAGRHALHLRGCQLPLTGPAGETLQSVTIATLPATGFLA